MREEKIAAGDKDRSLQFRIGEAWEDGFAFIFVGDGDVAELSCVDQDTLVDDLLNLVRSIEPAE